MQIGREEQTAADERMRANWVLYEIDKVDLFMLLDARENLLQSSEQFNADSVQYALSTVDVAYQAGRLLNDLGISIVGSDLEQDASKVDQTLRESLPKPASEPQQEIQTLESSQPADAPQEVLPLPEPRADQSTFVIPPTKATPPSSLRLPKPGSSDVSPLPSRIPTSVTETTDLSPAQRDVQELNTSQPSGAMIEADGEPPLNLAAPWTSSGDPSGSKAAVPRSARIGASMPSTGNTQLPKRIGTTQASGNTL